jgi:hypothetical protein
VLLTAPARTPDGDKAEILAKLLLELDQDAAAYDAMLAWKTKGYSDDFKAMMDLTDLTSSCRSCVSLADERRHVLGPNVYDARVLRTAVVSGKGEFALCVRERGNYAFVKLGFASRPTLRALVAAALAHIQPRQKNVWKDNEDLRSKPVRVYSFSTVVQRLPVLSDQDVAALPPNAELEVIFV